MVSPSTQALRPQTQEVCCPEMFHGPAFLIFNHPSVFPPICMLSLSTYLYVTGYHSKTLFSLEITTVVSQWATCQMPSTLSSSSSSMYTGLPPGPHLAFSHQESSPNLLSFANSLFFVLSVILLSHLSKLR